MPEFYGTDKDNPDIYVASQREISDELGIHVDTASISSPAFVRDNEGSPNVSILFEANLGLSKDEILARHQKAKDAYEHDQILFFKADEVFSRLERGNYNFEGTTPPNQIVGASVGAVLDYGRREVGENWYGRAKSALEGKGIRVIEEI